MGRTDDLQELNEALALLVKVATGEKNQRDVREWLETNHPELCRDEPKKKW